MQTIYHSKAFGFWGPALLLVGLVLMAQLSPSSGLRDLRGALTFKDVIYEDDYIHFGQLIRFSDWVDRAWGVMDLSVGATVIYNKFQPVTHTSWRLVPYPLDYNLLRNSNPSILIASSWFSVVSRDGSLAWSCDENGRLKLVDYQAALQGDGKLIKAMLYEKHGRTNWDGTPLPRGFQWVKMRFAASGSSDVTPTDSGLVWKAMPSDPSYRANHGGDSRNWEYGFQVQDVDFTDPEIK